MASLKKPTASVVLAMMLFALEGCWQREAHEIVIQTGNLAVSFVDNESILPDHKAGYNGIARLVHAEQPEPVLVPAYAGFNLEHIFAGDSLADLFEPRHAPMKLRKLSDTAVGLYQPPTPISKVESWTTFTLVPPNAIDVVFRCKIHGLGFFPHDYAGLFWASYIHAPEDKRVWFWGLSDDNPTARWIGAYSEKHGVASTHCSVKDTFSLYFATNFQATLASHFSHYRYAMPFFFGRFQNMVLIFMFDNDQNIRFSQSPTGGGPANPAWDFQFIIAPVRKDASYGFKARLVYKPFVSNEDVLAEYEAWKNAADMKK